MIDNNEQEIKNLQSKLEKIHQLNKEAENLYKYEIKEVIENLERKKEKMEKLISDIENECR